MNEDVVICRCEEVTESEVRRAIQEGAASMAGIARRHPRRHGALPGKDLSLPVSAPTGGRGGHNDGGSQASHRTAASKAAAARGLEGPEHRRR